MKISIGSDHRGYELKSELIKHIIDVTWLDVGTGSAQARVDYPLFARSVCKDVLTHKADRGILICGSGIGIAIAANRFKGIYAALCWNKDVAMIARNHDLANVLVLPADFITIKDALSIVQIWLHSDFLGGHYQKRLEMIDEPEK